MGVAVGDYDNDGEIDVLITERRRRASVSQLGRRQIQRRNRDAPAWAATRTIGARPPRGSTMDNDGDLDLLCRQLRALVAGDRSRSRLQTGRRRARLRPADEFRRRVSRTSIATTATASFTEVAEAAGLQIKNSATGVPTAKTLGVVAVDLDGDGWMDLIVANDTVQNHLFHNEQNGTFKEIGATAGIAFDSYGATRGAMGIDAARLSQRRHARRSRSEISPTK